MPFIGGGGGGATKFLDITGTLLNTNDQIFASQDWTGYSWVAFQNKSVGGSGGTSILVEVSNDGIQWTQDATIIEPQDMQSGFIGSTMAVATSENGFFVMPLYYPRFRLTLQNGVGATITVHARAYNTPFVFPDQKVMRISSDTGHRVKTWTAIDNPFTTGDNGVVALSAGYLWDGWNGQFFRHRTPGRWKTLVNTAITAGTPLAAWTPFVGGTIKLMGFSLSLSVAGQIILKDATTEFLRSPQLAAGGIFQLGCDALRNGYIFSAVNNALNIDVTANGSVGGSFWGSEE